MKCAICGKEIYRKYYPFEGKKWCHACVEEHSVSIVEKKEKKKCSTS